MDPQPLFEELNLAPREKQFIKPYFTNLDKPVFAVQMIPPELIGAICSRASRAEGDLRRIFLDEYVKPFIKQKGKYGHALKSFTKYLYQNPPKLIFANPKSRRFYVQWLAQFGDDSIAQMAGTHLIFSSLSLVTIKHFEQMRIGISPIEKSTRYVDYSTQINDQYRYYTDPILARFNLSQPYTTTMDHLFDTYCKLLAKMKQYFQHKYPDESQLLINTKTFDTIRGILPLATLSQVAFYANGQAFEYAYNRAIKYPLTEVQWAAQELHEELSKVIPAFLRRVTTETGQDYQAYLAEHREVITQTLDEIGYSRQNTKSIKGVKLVEYDPEGENKVIAALIFPTTHESYTDILEKVRRMSLVEKETILERTLTRRKFRWYKAPRALEDAYVKFEITSNWGAWKDLQRHRMLTELHELFNPHHGFDTPAELIEAGLADQFNQAIERVNELFGLIEHYNPLLAQYSVTQAHYIRYLQIQNLRSFFWETELRTIAQGHPDYRQIEQEKVRLIQAVYPIISQYLLVDMTEHTFAQRQTENRITQKANRLQERAES